MKNDLSSSVHDTIKCDWIGWKDRLGNPTTTPRQLMRTYVQELDILVVALDEEMDWPVWVDYTTDTYPDDASE
jgi:hypothetical protein